MRQHFADYYPHLKPVYMALQELALDTALLTFDVVDSIAAHVSEPNGQLECDYSPELERVLRALGMPFRSMPEGWLPTIVIGSDGLGYDWGNGKTSGWRATPEPHGGWRQRPTDTVGNVHLALLACSDGYWDVMPARLKTSEVIVSELPALFRVNTVTAIPRAAIRDKALAVLGRS